MLEPSPSTEWWNQSILVGCIVTIDPSLYIYRSLSLDVKYICCCEFVQMLPASYMVKKFGAYVVVDIAKKNRSKQSVTRFLSGGAYWGMVFGPWTDRAGVSSPIPLCANVMQLETSIYNWTAILLYAIGTLTSLYSGFFSVSTTDSFACIFPSI